MPLFGSRAALEHFAQDRDLEVSDDLPDEIDLDLGGWLSTGQPEPPLAEVLELWHLLYDDPVVGQAARGGGDRRGLRRPGRGDDRLVRRCTARRARKALTEAVALLRKALRPV